MVKLNQFHPNDDQQIVINTKRDSWLPGHGGLKVMPLHEHNGISTALVKWPAHEQFLPHTHFGGEEIFVISGTFMDEFGEYPQYTWLRNKNLSQHFPKVKEETVIWVKTGHLL